MVVSDLKHAYMEAQRNALYAMMERVNNIMWDCLSSEPYDIKGAWDGLSDVCEVWANDNPHYWIKWERMVREPHRCKPPIQEGEPKDTEWLLDNIALEAENQRLQAEVKRLREALRVIADPDNWWESDRIDNDVYAEPCTIWRGVGEPDEIADDALRGEQEA